MRRVREMPVPSPHADFKNANEVENRANFVFFVYVFHTFIG